MGINVDVITGRTLKQGSYVDSKLSREYFEAVAICEINPDDCMKLGVRSGDKVKIKTDYGETVVFVRESKEVPEGIVFIPLGPYANMVIDPDTKGTGMPGFKGIKGIVEKTDEIVLQLDEIVDQLRVV